MLDGRAVAPEEPQQAVQALRHEEVLMALMLSNACLVHKLVRYHNWLHSLYIYCTTKLSGQRQIVILLISGLMHYKDQQDCRCRISPA